MNAVIYARYSSRAQKGSDAMRRLRAFGLVLCALVLLISLTAPVFAAEDQTPEEILQQMLCYYQHHQSAAKTDICRLLAQMEALDPEQAALWRNIFEYWFYANDEMPRNNTVLPDDLPQDDTLCIVILGYQLGSTGYMMPELIGRLELALAAAEQYPNALLLCSGGGTAAEKTDVTEAGAMARWLRQQGISRERIIRERRSTHTVQNALFTFDMLTADFPQVTQLVIVTSDYHLPRSTTLFHARAQLSAHQSGGVPVQIAAVLGYDAGHDGVAEDPLDQTAHLARVAGFEYQKADEPPLSCLVDLSVSGEEVLETGLPPKLTVTAHYDTGFSRDVTAYCAISGYTPESEQPQTLTVTYAENGTQVSAAFEIRRPAPETTPTQPTETKAPTEPPISPENPENTVPWYAIGIPLGMLVLIILFKKRR